MNIVALATVHNRISKTTSILQDLENQILPDGITLKIVIVDDNSSDGTYQTISEQFPTVQLIRGDGQLYWAGGMLYGWSKTVQHMHFDALLVFNDDVRLKKTALAQLISAYKSVLIKNDGLNVISGATLDFANQSITYGGYNKVKHGLIVKIRKVVPSGFVQPIDTLNMNFALIPRSVLDTIGFLSNCYSHALGDVDFGFRVKTSGGQVWLAEDSIGWCDTNESVVNESGSGRWLRLKNMISVKGLPLKPWYTFNRRHGETFWFVRFLAPYLKLLVFNKQR